MQELLCGKAGRERDKRHDWLALAFFGSQPLLGLTELGWQEPVKTVTLILEIQITVVLDCCHLTKWEFCQ